MMTIEAKLEHKVEMAEHFGIEPFDGSSLAEAVDYLVEGESSSDYIRTYARGYAELAERYHAKQNAEAGKRDIDITAEDIRKVPSGDPAQWEIELRELCQEIEQLPASEQQTAISVKASAIYQSLAEFNRYCGDQFEEMKKARPDLFGKQAEGGIESAVGSKVK